MNSSKDLKQNLDDFKRITIDFDDINYKVEDEVQAIILLNSFPNKYKDVKPAIMYEKDTLTFDLVVSSLK